MNLSTKPDYPAVLERFEAWWHCEMVDRPLVSLAVRHPNPPPVRWPDKRHHSLRERWMDVEYQIDCAEAGISQTYYFADNVPIYWPNLGPELAGALFGCDLEFGETTSWSKPRVNSIRDILALRPDLECEYWQTIRRLTDMSLERGQGRWITGITDLHTNGDLLASLRDPQTLCLDVMDDPAGVRMACEHVTSFYPLYYDDLWSRINAHGQPCTTTVSFLHQGRCFLPCCDFIALLSNQVFETLIVPSIRSEMAILERSMFHLDGVNALQHLDTILSWPDLNALQFVYGEGRGPGRQYVDVLRRAQAAGKALQIICEDLEDAQAIASCIKPAGVWLCPGGSYSLEQAETFLHWVERWGSTYRSRPGSDA